MLGNPAAKVNNLPMPPKSKRIHLVDRANSLVRLTTEGQVWESGYWAVPEATAKSLLGGSILFHKKRQEPSFFGGLILNYRLHDKGQSKGQVIFTFEYRADHRGVMAEAGGWSKDVKVVRDK